MLVRTQRMASLRSTSRSQSLRSPLSIKPAQQLLSFMQSAFAPAVIPASAVMLFGIPASGTLLAPAAPAAAGCIAAAIVMVIVMFIGAVVETGGRMGASMRAGTAGVVSIIAAVCVAVWLSGYTVRTRRLYVAGLEERAATAERERDHLARIAVANERASIAQA